HVSQVLLPLPSQLMSPDVALTSTLFPLTTAPEPRVTSEARATKAKLLKNRALSEKLVLVASSLTLPPAKPPVAWASSRAPVPTVTCGKSPFRFTSGFQ